MAVLGLPAFIALVGIADMLEHFNNEYAAESGSHDKVAKLRWKTIKSLYKINKQRWRYEPVVSKDGKYRSEGLCLLYNSGDEWIHSESKKKKILPYLNKVDIVRVQLSFLDYIKFLWASTFAREMDIGTEMILTSAQEDIDKITELAMTRIEESQKIIDDVINKQKEKDQNITLKL